MVKPLDVGPIAYQAARPGSFMATLRQGLRPGSDVDAKGEEPGIGFEQWKRGVMWNYRDDYGTRMPHLSPSQNYEDPAGTTTAVASDLVWRPPAVAPASGWAWPVQLQAWVDKAKPGDAESADAEARRKLEVFRSSLLAGWFATGIAGRNGASIGAATPWQTPNPSLKSKAVSLAASATAVSAELGISQILARASSDEYPGDLVFHANPVLAPVLRRNGLLEQRGDVMWLLGMYRLVLEMSYPGTAPTNYGGSAMPSNTSWLYATGPVEWDLNPSVDIDDRTHPTTLSTWARASQWAVVRFDPHTVYASAINYGVS